MMFWPDINLTLQLLEDGLHRFWVVKGSLAIHQNTHRCTFASILLMLTPSIQPRPDISVILTGHGVLKNTMKAQLCSPLLQPTYKEEPFPKITL